MVDLQPHMRFKNYKNLFTKLLNYKSVPTKYPIISMMITYDSEKAITVTKKSDRTYIIKMYCLKNYNITFEEHLGGTRESFIKAKEIEQTNSGKFYACAYFNDGKFRLRTFGRETRSQKEIKENEVDINELLGINDFTMPNEDLPDPFINCAFVNDHEIFVALYHGKSNKHYHFIWDLKKLSMKNNKPFSRELEDSTSKNFPFKSFYSDEKNQIFCFYR